MHRKRPPVPASTAATLPMQARQDSFTQNFAAAAGDISPIHGDARHSQTLQPATVTGSDRPAMFPQSSTGIQRKPVSTPGATSPQAAPRVDHGAAQVFPPSGFQDPHLSHAPLSMDPNLPPPYQTYSQVSPLDESLAAHGLQSRHSMSQEFGLGPGDSSPSSTPISHATSQTPRSASFSVPRKASTARVVSLNNAESLYNANPVLSEEAQQRPPTMSHYSYGPGITIQSPLFNPETPQQNTQTPIQGLEPPFQSQGAASALTRVDPASEASTWDLYKTTSKTQRLRLDAKDKMNALMQNKVARRVAAASAVGVAGAVEVGGLLIGVDIFKNSVGAANAYNNYQARQERKKAAKAAQAQNALQQTQSAPQQARSGQQEPQDAPNAPHATNSSQASAVQQPPSPMQNAAVGAGPVLSPFMPCSHGRYFGAHELSEHLARQQQLFDQVFALQNQLSRLQSAVAAVNPGLLQVLLQSPISSPLISPAVSYVQSFPLQSSQGIRPGMQSTSPTHPGPTMDSGSSTTTATSTQLAPGPQTTPVAQGASTSSSTIPVQPVPLPQPAHPTYPAQTAQPAQATQPAPIAQGIPTSPSTANAQAPPQTPSDPYFQLSPNVDLSQQAGSMPLGSLSNHPPANSRLPTDPQQGNPQPLQYSQAMSTGLISPGSLPMQYPAVPYSYTNHQFQQPYYPYQNSAQFGSLSPYQNPQLAFNQALYQQQLQAQQAQEVQQSQEDLDLQMDLLTSTLSQMPFSSNVTYLPTVPTTTSAAPQQADYTTTNVYNVQQQSINIPPSPLSTAPPDGADYFETGGNPPLYPVSPSYSDEGQAQFSEEQNFVLDESASMPDTATLDSIQ